MKKKVTATQKFIEQDKKEAAKKKARSSKMFGSRLFNVPDLDNGGFRK
jgi:hypothetical protein